MKEKPQPTIIDELNKSLERERVDLPNQEHYPPSVETIGIALEIPPNVVHWWAENDRDFRASLENMKEVDGADIALLLMETKKRYDS